MSDTLIVRDATLAINGAPETRGDPYEHLQERIQDVAAKDPSMIEATVEVLRSVVGSGEEVNLEILEALTILGLAQPMYAEQMGVSAVSTGRRLAARKEQATEPEYAMAILETLLDAFPGDAAVERDYAALLRRQGMIHDLVQRYLDRAERFLREGKEEEAIQWLREALLLDRSRKDIARRIRDLRLRNGRSGRTSVRLRPVFAAVLVVLGSVALVQRERNLYTEFHALPPSEPGNLESMRTRLHAIEAFVDAHPVWHGAISAVSERSELRVEVDRLEVLEADRRQADEKRRQEEAEEAQLVRARGLMRVDSGDLEGALADFRHALELTSDSWPMREQTERDIEAILEHMKGDE